MCLHSLEQHKAKMAFFADTSEFIAFNKYPQVYAQGMQGVEAQLVNAVNQGHSLQLHLHPQWIDAVLEDPDWQLSLDKWRIGDLSEAETNQCAVEGLDYLQSLLARAEKSSAEHCKVFRAGGWAIQPSDIVLKVLREKGIQMESTVAPGAFNPAKGDWFDFRRAENQPWWRVETDVCKTLQKKSGADEGAQGQIIEVPITTAGVGRLAHARALKEHRSSHGLPEGCSGSYDGPNSRLQGLRAKLSKIVNMGRVMLDFSIMPGWVLVDITRRYQEQHKACQGPVPIVAIGHNKNFTARSNAHLNYWLDWVSQQRDIQFSTYANWQSSI